MNYLDEGTFGKIYVDSNGNIVKEFKDFISYAELDVLFRFDCEYLLKGIELKDDKLILEKCDSNFNVLLTNTTLFDQIPKFMLELAIGLRCLHRNNFLHLDISTNNTMLKLVNGEYVALLIDFGLGVYTDNSKSILLKQNRFNSFCSPPECKYNQINLFNDKSDVWALGIIFLSMAIKNHVALVLYPKYKDTITDKLILKQKITEFFSIPNAIKTILTNFDGSPKVKNLNCFVNLLENMLKINNAERFNIEQVIDHPYFTPQLKNEIYFKFGNYCRIKPTLTYDIYEKDFGPNKYLGIKYINALFYTYWRNSRTSIMVLVQSIDLYLRIIESIPENILTETSVYTFCIFCLKISFNLYETLFDNETKQFSKDNEKWLMKNEINRQNELTVLSFFNGIYKRLNFFDYCSYKQDLIDFMERNLSFFSLTPNQHVFDFCGQYTSYNFEHQNVPIINRTDSKYFPISELWI